MVEENLISLQERLTSGLAEIRESIHEIHSSSLDLEFQIEQTIREYPDLNIELFYNIREIKDYKLKFDILNLVKESILNTHKHSTGKNMTISV